MCYAFNASIYVVGWGDAVQVIDIWFQAQEELDCGIYLTSVRQHDLLNQTLHPTALHNKQAK